MRRQSPFGKFFLRKTGKNSNLIRFVYLKVWIDGTSTNSVFIYLFVIRSMIYLRRDYAESTATIDTYPYTKCRIEIV